jgi:hypothetical protein
MGGITVQSLSVGSPPEGGIRSRSARFAVFHLFTVDFLRFYLSPRLFLFSKAR